MTVTVVDAFAERPFEGNPAAVCVLEAPAPEAWMRALAREMNLSETAFVTPGERSASASPTSRFALRWLTPEVEVDLCGHATLASAHLLYEDGHVEADTPVRFDTRSGRLTVRRTGDQTYAMDFPATPPVEAPVHDGFVEAFGVAPAWTGRTPFDVFVVLESEAAVRGLDVDPALASRIDARGIIVTALADESEGLDVVSRFFAPGSGVPEDPVTGSAHCAIGPYWAERLGLEAVSCYQASPRGGHVRVRPLGDRVEIEGSAVTVHRSSLEAAALPAR